MPMINEAIFCVMEGVATPEAIDTVMKLGMAHPMGPLALADFIGLDVCLAILEVLHRGLGDDKYRPCPLLRRMVAAGHLGRKSGQRILRLRSGKGDDAVIRVRTSSLRMRQVRARAARPLPRSRRAATSASSPSTTPPWARRSAARASGSTRSTEDAITDALRLARGMTYKSAVAGLNPGRRQVGHHRRQQAGATARRSSGPTAASSRR